MQSTLLMSPRVTSPNDFRGPSKSSANNDGKAATLFPILKYTYVELARPSERFPFFCVINIPLWLTMLFFRRTKRVLAVAIDSSTPSFPFASLSSATVDKPSVRRGSARPSQRHPKEWSATALDRAVHSEPTWGYCAIQDFQLRQLREWRRQEERRKGEKKIRRQQEGIFQAETLQETTVSTRSLRCAALDCQGLATDSLLPEMGRRKLTRNELS